MQMYARVTNFQIDPSQVEAVTAAMEGIKPKIQTIPGIKSCLSSWREDGNGVTVAVYEDQEAAEAATESVKEIWASMGQYLTSAPTTEVYDTVEDLLD
jgi:quinol monooxygenase YgiN